MRTISLAYCMYITAFLQLLARINSPCCFSAFHLFRSFHDCTSTAPSDRRNATLEKHTRHSQNANRIKSKKRENRRLRSAIRLTFTARLHCGSTTSCDDVIRTYFYGCVPLNARALRASSGMCLNNTKRSPVLKGTATVLKETLHFSFSITLATVHPPLSRAGKTQHSEEGRHLKYTNRIRFGERESK